MTNSEAIETLQANYPDACYGLLRDAVDTAIYALSAQPEIIYCGECKYMMPNGRCSAFADPSIRPSASDYCSSAERRQYE